MLKCSKMQLKKREQLKFQPMFAKIWLIQCEGKFQLGHDYTYLRLN